MPTLRSLAFVTSGLYRDLNTGQVYQRDELLATLPNALLSRRVRLERAERGVYRLLFENGDGQVVQFELWSRRRSARASVTSG